MSDSPFTTPTTGWQQGSSNGGGADRPQKPPVLLLILGGGAVLFIVLVGMLIWQGSSSTAPDAVQAPVRTPIPTAGAKLTAIEMADQLIANKQYEAAAYMAEKALKTTRSEQERTALQERALTAHLHALLTQEPDYLTIPVQHQQVKQYLYLKRQAQAAGITFLSSLEVGQLAKANSHWRLAKFAYEEAYKEGAWSQANTLIMRQYEEVLFRQGWWQATHGTDAVKDEGLRLLALRYAFDKAHGKAKDHAWAELRKHCGPDERTWPEPIDTPLLAHSN
jgi:hypothetical protein